MKIATLIRTGAAVLFLVCAMSCGDSPCGFQDGELVRSIDSGEVGRVTDTTSWNFTPWNLKGAKCYIRVRFPSRTAAKMFPLELESVGKPGMDD